MELQINIVTYYCTNLIFDFQKEDEKMFLDLFFLSETPLLFDSCRRPPSTTSDHFFKIFPYRAVAYVRLLWYQQKNPLGTKTSIQFTSFLLALLCWVMEKSGGQRTNNTFRDVAVVPTGRQHPTHPNSKPPALIPTLKKNARQGQETKLLRNNFSLLWSQNSY